MRWYNSKTVKVEDVGAPSTDEEALEMLWDHPDSGRLVERYVVLREEGLGVEQALLFVGHRLGMTRPMRPTQAARENPDAVSEGGPPHEGRTRGWTSSCRLRWGSQAGWKRRAR